MFFETIYNQKPENRILFEIKKLLELARQKIKK